MKANSPSNSKKCRKHTKTLFFFSSSLNDAVFFEHWGCATFKKSHFYNAELQ